VKLFVYSGHVALEVVVVDDDRAEFSLWVRLGIGFSSALSYQKHESQEWERMAKLY
jgi:hypothetical protein